jgi:hypothetical protein
MKETGANRGNDDSNRCSAQRRAEASAVRQAKAAVTKLKQPRENRGQLKQKADKGCPRIMQGASAQRDLRAIVSCHDTTCTDRSAGRDSWGDFGCDLSFDHPPCHSGA